MPSGLGPLHSSRVSRAIYVLSILLVFSYIFFDVLDLDGSDFPRLFTPVERTIIVAVVPSATQFNYSPEHSELRDDIDLLYVDRSGLYARPQWAKLLRASPLGPPRSHGYRVGLARNSLPDSSPYW
jgi:hypothetical protein